MKEIQCDGEPFIGNRNNWHTWILIPSPYRQRDSEPWLYLSVTRDAPIEVTIKDVKKVYNFYVGRVISIQRTGSSNNNYKWRFAFNEKDVHVWPEEEKDDRTSLV